MGKGIVGYLISKVRQTNKASSANCPDLNPLPLFSNASALEFDSFHIFQFENPSQGEGACLVLYLLRTTQL